MSEHETVHGEQQGEEQDETQEGDDAGKQGDDGQQGETSAPDHGSDGGAV